MDNNAQVVDVNLTRVDLLMTSLWAPMRMPAVYAIVWLGLFAINVHQQMNLPRFHWATGEVVRIVVVAAIVAVIFTIGAGLFSVICMQIINTRSRGVLGAHRYRLTPEGFVESTAVNESLQRWTPELRAWRVPGYFLIRTPPLGVHAIPLRSFRDGSAAERFWDTLQAHLRQAANAHK